MSDDSKFAGRADVLTACVDDLAFEREGVVGHSMDPSRRTGHVPRTLRGLRVPESYAGSVVEVHGADEVYFVFVPHGIEWASPSRVVPTRAQANGELLSDLKEFLLRQGTVEPA